MAPAPAPCVGLTDSCETAPSCSTTIRGNDELQAGSRAAAGRLHFIAHHGASSEKSTTGAPVEVVVSGGWMSCERSQLKGEKDGLEMQFKGA